jgi:hypothetical protein
VNGKVDFTTGAGTVTIVVQNLQTGMNTVAQAISDIEFALSTGQTSATVTDSYGLERWVNDDKTFTDGSVVHSLGWTLQAFPPPTFEIDVLNTATAPTHTILGPANGSSYPNAGSSIANTGGPHNPFLAGPVTFVLNVPGVTVDSTISTARLSFGTADTEVTDVTLQPNPGPGDVPVPEPTKAIALSGLFGMGLVGMALWRRKSAG